MTMNMSELRERVIQRYPHAEQIDDSVLCFTRNRGNQPFAIYYLDIAIELPDTKESLNKYQDRLIGKRYFDGRKSLQWSNYLYFLRSDEELSSSEARQAKELIENDRTYTRKFVIPEKEIDSILVPHTVSSSENGRHENVLFTWIKLLTEASLDRAILSDEDLPARLRHIESDTKKPGKTSTPIKMKSVKPAQFLSTLELSLYPRPFPLKRRFDFGSVNLIFGANASGKTSLIEAIELFYCGRNKRNPDPTPHYRLDAVLADGKEESATSQRSPRVFRERNLSWYGQAEVKTKNLYKSFAQFNFLDTDAAVSLSESTKHIEEDLSKLLVGPDASKIWRDIERVGDEVHSKLKELRPYKGQIETELSRLEILLSDIASERRQSDVILERLSNMLTRHHWKPVGDEAESFLKTLHGSLTELISVGQQAVEIKWVVSPTTRMSLENYLRDVSRRIDVAEPKLARINELNKERSQANAVTNRFENARTLVNEVIHYIDSGLPDRATEYAEIKKTIGLYSNQLLSFEDEFIKILSVVETNKTVSNSLKTASNMRLEAEAAFSAAKKEHSDFARLCEESTNLSQQLRQIAGKVIETAEKPDECPLCHTQFKPGELARHMTLGVDEHLEALGQSLLSRIKERETAFDNLRQLETALIWFQQFCKNSFKEEDAAVGEAVARLHIVQNELAAAQQRHKVLDKEIERLSEAGLSAAQFDELLSELNELGFKLDDHRQATAGRLLSQIDKHALSQSENIEKITKEINEIETALKEILNLSKNDPEFENEISILREQFVTTETIIARLSEICEEFQWPYDRPISELITTADNIRKVASEARTALAHERHINSQQSEGLKRKEGLKGQLEKLDHRIERFSQAQNVLNKVRREHSLNQAMKSALELNRAAIETIFASIHSPAEFAGLGPSLETLVRKVDGSRATLKEISTGQRAAFGLSVFLAQNSQLTAGPPVVLIDDAIAHVDDLNALSFLDYLREIAITGKRQIFFTTANDKLATLFERKFDFLGKDEFKRFNLSR